MATTIIKLDDNKFYCESRGNKMTLVKELCEVTGSFWRMYTDNASRRAYRNGVGFRDFDNLEEVEKAYKSWHGISKLVEQDDKQVSFN